MLPNDRPPVRLVVPCGAPKPVNPVIVGGFIAFVCPNEPNAEVVLPKPPNEGAAEDAGTPNDGAPKPVAGFCPATFLNNFF